MDRTSADDECVDSGAETGGSDYSPLSSASSELSMGELQDPFLVSVHLIADPGQGRFLQSAADGVLAYIHPELELFRVSERAFISQHTRPKHQAAACQPALAVILFLQEAYGGEEQILMLHRMLQQPPWRYHHAERVSNGVRMLPLSPCSHDFFSLAPGTPLWAVRQVHYGKEIVRFTVYCRHENYVDMVRLYKLLLQRRVAQKKEDFCLFVVYSNADMEIQLSFKRLPRGQSPQTLESAVLEVRVRDVGALVPLLPHPCSPISQVRWQTADYDGNKILLQVQSSPFRHKPPHISSSSAAQSASAPSLCTRNVASYRIRQHHRTSSRPRAQHQVSHSSLQLACEELEEHEQPHQDSWSCQWRGHRSSSMFSLPNMGSASSRSTCSSPGPSPSPHHRSCSLHQSSSFLPPFRINVDALIGAEETDVDTGNKVNACSCVDLTVVSAYIKSSPQWTPTPPKDVSTPFTTATLPTNVGKSSTRVRPPVPVRTNSLSAKSTTTTTTTTMLRSCPQNTHAALSDALNQPDTSTGVSAEQRCFLDAQTGEEEDHDAEEQEFYI
ncbi:protein FAM124A [Genypterus blacodes]|uniref:protein FAM124A n=1 Tax=Genypterus blacodes TaxID=154954 RepID=UPI003F76385C